MIIWVIIPPLFAFIILFKYRHQLEEDHVKNYYLILYQGLRHKVFYWEFINTIRKVMIISLNTILSVLSLEYRVLFGILLLFAVARIQLMMNPYKLKENNDIEVMSIIAGLLILYCGIIFEEGQDYNYPLFDFIAVIILVVFNSIFLTQWMYYFLESINFKNENLKKLVQMYGTLLCKRKKEKEGNTKIEIDETEYLKAGNDEKDSDEDQIAKPKKSTTIRTRYKF